MDLEKVRASRGADTAYLLGKDSLPSHLGDRTLERFALVVPARTDVIVKFLQRPNCTDSYPMKLQDGSVRWVVSFGNGSLTIPLLQHEKLPLKFRNRLPVLFVLDEEMLFVEYDWNPMAFGRGYIDTAKQTGPVVGLKKTRLSAHDNVQPDALQVGNVCPIPWGKGIIDDGRYSISALLRDTK